jgi:outer membrane protein
MSLSSPYVSGDDDLLLVPIVQYEGTRVYFRGLRLGYRLLNEQPWSVSVIAQPRLLHLDQEDFEIDTNIRDRDRSVDLGVSVERTFKRFRGELLVVTDILGRSNGQEATARLAMPLRFGPVSVTPDASVRYWSDNLIDYYAGIAPEEVRLEEFIYDPEPAVVPELGITARIPLSRSLLLAAQYRYRFLSDEFTESPLIDDDYESSLFLGVTYMFDRK